MPIRNERENVYCLEMPGLLRKAGVEQCEQAVANEIERSGPVRLLVLLEQFEGWESQ